MPKSEVILSKLKLYILHHHKYTKINTLSKHMFDIILEQKI